MNYVASVTERYKVRLLFFYYSALQIFFSS